jgi:hypothetical protein
MSSASATSALTLELEPICVTPIIKIELEDLVEDSCMGCFTLKTLQQVFSLHLNYTFNERNEKVPLPHSYKYMVTCFPTSDDPTELSVSANLSFGRTTIATIQLDGSFHLDRQLRLDEPFPSGIPSFRHCKALDQEIFEVLSYTSYSIQRIQTLLG